MHSTLSCGNGLVHIIVRTCLLSFWELYLHATQPVDVWCVINSPGEWFSSLYFSLLYSLFVFFVQYGWPRDNREAAMSVNERPAKTMAALMGGGAVVVQEYIILLLFLRCCACISYREGGRTVEGRVAVATPTPSQKAANKKLENLENRCG